jgi:Tfp pilus assembly protein PilO
MSLLKAILNIPFLPLLIVVISGALGYRDYTEWNEVTYQPLLATLETKKGEIERVRADVARAQDFDRTRKEKLMQLQELARKLELTANAMPRSANIPDLLKSLADLADKAGIEFSSFRPQAERRREFLVLSPIEVQLKGNYVQIMSFLDSAANLTRVVSCEKLSLEGTSPRGGVNILSAGITLVTYHLEEELRSGVDTSTPPPDPKAADGKGG